MNNFRHTVFSQITASLSKLKNSLLRALLVLAALCALPSIAAAWTVNIINQSTAVPVQYQILNGSGGTVKAVTVLNPGQNFVFTGAVGTVFIYNHTNSSSVSSGIPPAVSPMYSSRNISITNDATVIITDTPTDCAASSVTWGAGNFCAAAVPSIAQGAIRSIANTTSGAAGSITASCDTGNLTYSAPICNSNLASPPSLAATDGTVSNGINLTWGAVAGASGYRVQFRAQGASTWQGDLYAGASTAYNWAGLADERIFEFQVRSENAVGTSVWSAVEPGNIRKLVDPQFISQSGIPAKIGVGQNFTFSQIWKNNGSETWSGGAYGTGPINPANTSVWGTAFIAFPGSTATAGTTSTSITVTAPTTPGTYPLQRIMQKSGTPYGTASTLVNVQVIGAPVCTGVAPDISTTYNANATITVALQGASSVENAWIRVSGQNGGPTSQYAMTLSGSTWTATFPIGFHLTPGETKINIQALVSNSLFTSQTECATSAVTFQQLPAPIVTLTPTIGSYTEAGNQGFVANQINGEFAKATVNLGAFTGFKAKIEVVDGSNNAIVTPLTGVSHGVQLPMALSNSTLAGIASAWTSASAVVRVSYADAAAASQGKVTEIPIAWMTTPGALQVMAVATQGLPQVVNSKIKDGAGAFNAAAQGSFVGGLRATGTAAQISAFAAISATGEWSSTSLDYAQLYSTPMVAVARAEPPAGVTLLQPWEYVSAAFTLPVQAPAQVQATDGTREDDVEITWPAPAVGASIKYRVYRDGIEITPATGTAELEFIDIPPERGVTYTYTVKTLINLTTSENAASDPGFMPACRAARLIGASLNADMSAINGLLERWECLADLTGTSAINAGSPEGLGVNGSTVYRSFSVPVPLSLADGAHTLHINLISDGAGLNGNRSYDIPFTLNRASISVNSLTILYNGIPATNGVEANSVGRFGIRMEGGSGIGFAEEVK